MEHAQCAVGWHEADQQADGEVQLDHLAWYTTAAMGMVAENITHSHNAGIKAHLSKGPLVV